MRVDPLYVEEVSSKRTTALFVALAILFFLLAAWRARMAGSGPLTILLIFFCVFFAFYALNYRTLVIRLTPETLGLRFGLFAWAIPLDNLARCYRDDVSLWRIGGAGVHFTPLRGRYRAMFNFLEYPRVVLMLKVRMGPVRDIAFTTRRPEEVMRLIGEAQSQRMGWDAPEAPTPHEG